MTAVIPFIISLFCVKVVAFGEDEEGANQKCGNVERKLMQPFRYISDPEFNKQPEENVGEKHILKAEPALDNGLYSEVFVGYFGTNDEPFSTSKCVAVRLGKGEEWRKDAARNGAKVLREMKRYFNGKWPKHLINTIDIGQTQNGDYVTVMELADKSLKEYYQPGNFERENYAKLVTTIQHMVEPLMEMHKVAIHADLKLRNYIVMKDEKGNNMAKLIDFDSSVVILPPPPSEKHTTSSRLNRLFRPLWPQRSASEMGPEYKKPNITMISTKSDIWTIGIMIYELILLQPKMSAFGMDQKLKLEKMLGQISEIYRGYRWLNKHEAQDLVYNGEFLQEYSSALMVLLGVQEEIPEIFVLLSNLLNQEPTSRMSARAILDYLNGNCEPAAEVTKQFKLFANITCQVLDGLIVEAIKVDTEKPKNGWKQKLVSMRDLLKMGNERILEE